MARTGEILAQLLKLPGRQRAKLAAELIQSLDECEDVGAAGAWLEELERRVHEITSGTAKLDDWAEVREKLELRLRRGIA
jgi:hypothetical protein